MSQHTEQVDDLSSLAWVQEELRKSLDTAHKSLRRYLKEIEAKAGSDVDDVEPAILRTARQQLHQSVGALELVGLPAAATLLRASETAVQRFISKPHKITNEAVEGVERASFALLDYLGRLLAGKPASPVSMFPQYKVVQEIAGAERVHPADLWTLDWEWEALPRDARATPRAADAQTTSEFEGLLLAFMQAKPESAEKLSALC